MEEVLIQNVAKKRSIRSCSFQSLHNNINKCSVKNSYWAWERYSKHIKLNINEYIFYKKLKEDKWWSKIGYMKVFIDIKTGNISFQIVINVTVLSEAPGFTRHKQNTDLYTHKHPGLCWIFYFRCLQKIRDNIK